MQKRQNIKFKIFLVFGIIILVVIYKFNFLDSKTNDSTNFSTKNDSPQTSPIEKTTPTESLKSDPSTSSQAKPSETKNQQENQWLDDQAKALDQPEFTANESDVIRSLKEHIKNATIEEKKLWSEVVLNPKQAQTKKIFSLYLISMDPTTSPKTLSNIINELPATDSSPAVHSPEEQIQTQTKALKAMAIDSLYEKALNKNTDALTELETLSKQSNESWIRNYATRKLRELSKSN